MAAASLIVDYVLNVAVSVAGLTSAFPVQLPYTLWLCLAVLAVVTAVNLRGIAESARVFIAPMAVFVGAIVTVVVVGLILTEPAAAIAAPGHVASLQTVGILLLLEAFANGCAALTGVEAIANAVPSFRKPRVRRTQRAEVALGGLLEGHLRAHREVLDPPRRRCHCVVADDHRVARRRVRLLRGAVLHGGAARARGELGCG